MMYCFTDKVNKLGAGLRVTLLQYFTSFGVSFCPFLTNFCPCSFFTFLELVHLLSNIDIKFDFFISTEKETIVNQKNSWKKISPSKLYLLNI